ncbi:2OG-Fe(II) oxygenase [Sphingopyxis sp. GW247-27LB]|uniref:2OG-Fe(II) oxygenase n=1 Tax=Sphingopyxis sp. GW247-27LB TaxID=2012632 RepID=UPI000BA5D533|nr:2OG-Fe(II) oxygenase [Sphingopyxis sp. GW247-27LB]PAL19611.1 proline hydroxylase [Sphingopyxis sp. GW247-27LB]
MLQAELKELTDRCSEAIRTAAPGSEYFDAPFKHVVLDDFLPRELADQCLNAFPPVDSDGWDEANDSDIEVKRRSNWTSEFDIPEHIVDAVRIMNSAPILRAMAERFEIPKIVPDPYFAGGGLNVTVSGGLLDVHVDGNYHDATGLNRRLNALIYLNPDWQPGWGGELGLYDDKGQECLKRIAPVHNRLVIFDTHDHSFHGLPDPLNFPAGAARRSIILYYYTKEARPESQTVVTEPHSALWVKRGLMDKRGNKTRQYT